MYAAIEEQLLAGRQAYIVCPLITESEVLQTASAEVTYESLRKKELKKWRVGLLHGRLKADEKDAIMRAFAAHELDVLVATTVIEVGVDVSNAAVMVILGADRFGLAQLHQLRGRVGRAQHKGQCYLVMSDSKAPPRRMRAIAGTTDGFKLAELDLELRGPGAIYGLRQSGALDLRLVQLSDTKLIAKTRAAVQELREKGENLLKYKQIAARIVRAESLTYLN
jgi:ATP-dependent DNA helicase RecG